MEFKTVPEELIPAAEAAFRYFRSRQYSIVIEPTAVEYPFTPAFRLKRGSTTIFVEVVSKFDKAAVDTWVRYAKSTGRDVRFSIVLTGPIGPEESAIAEELKVGLLHFDERIIRVRDGQDLALNLELPDLEVLPPKVRRRIAPVYETFEAGDWVQAFEDACRILEIEAREYLLREINKRTIAVATENSVKKLTATKINRLPLGALGEALQNIVNQNKLESDLATAIGRINPDRINVVHGKGNAAALRRLRGNVGPHIWLIFGAIKSLHN